MTLNNGVDNPLPVEGLLQVWQDQIPVHKSFTCNSSCGNFQTVYTVPSGRRMVIEYLTFRTLLGLNEHATISVETTLNGEEARHWLGVTDATPWNSPGGGELSMNFLSKSVKLYADPGTDVVFHYYSYAGIGYPFVDFSISGYLESIN